MKQKNTQIKHFYKHELTLLLVQMQMDGQLGYECIIICLGHDTVRQAIPVSYCEWQGGVKKRN